MATLGSTFFDLIDLYKRQEGDSQQIATVIELLKENNAILDDAVAMECNMGTKHRTTVRTGKQVAPLLRKQYRKLRELLGNLTETISSQANCAFA